MFLQITKIFNLLLIEIDQRALGRQKNSSIQQVTDLQKVQMERLLRPATLDFRI